MAVIQCDKNGCSRAALYDIVVKTSPDDDMLRRVCQEHRDELDNECKQNGWEFLEIH